MSNSIRIIMVEDHPEYREGIALALETEPDIQLTDQFGMAEQALKALEHDTTADVVLLDLNLPEMSGLEAIPWIKKYIGQYSKDTLKLMEDEQKFRCDNYIYVEDYKTIENGK